MCMCIVCTYYTIHASNVNISIQLHLFNMSFGHMKKWRNTLAMAKNVWVCVKTESEDANKRLFVFNKIHAIEMMWTFSVWVCVCGKHSIIGNWTICIEATNSKWQMRIRHWPVLFLEYLIRLSYL